MSVAGAASSLGGPITIAVGAAVIGVVFGSVAGYWRGPVDAVFSRATDLLLALPVVLVAIVVAGILGSGYWLTVALLIVLFSPTDYRIVRSAVIEQRPRPYIEATRLSGTSAARTLAVHVLPNVLRLVVANLLLNIAFAIVSLSSLSFLGLGVPDGTADWGRQLTDAKLVLGENPAAMIVPAVLIVLVASAVNILGDWLSEKAGGDAGVR
nr:ABC transporter permease subunit [Microbacterium ulmi]